jgi:hypothetical protein
MLPPQTGAGDSVRADVPPARTDRSPHFDPLNERTSEQLRKLLLLRVHEQLPFDLPQPWIVLFVVLRREWLVLIRCHFITAGGASVDA